jgi:3-methyladenine DNA glycosylase AlkD
VNVRQVVQAIEDRLRAVATPERAETEKRYLKSDLAFFGATVRQIRSGVKDALDREPNPTHDDVVTLAAELWAAPVFERRLAAIMVLDRFGDLLGVEDLPLIERLVRESRTWALVDGLAGDVLGDLVRSDSSRVSPILDRWAADDDFWVRRASLLAELQPIRHGAALERFLARAEPMVDEKEFFIRKAIGWVLREAGKRQPDDVAAWLAARTHRASGVTMREAVKYLPARDGERLMVAYRERRVADQ